MGLNDNYRKSLEKIGEEHRVLDAAQMREMTGSHYYRGGLYTPGAVMIQPADYISGLARGISSKVIIHEHSPVLELSRKGRTWKAKTACGSVSDHAPVLSDACCRPRGDRRARARARRAAARIACRGIEHRVLR